MHVERLAGEVGKAIGDRLRKGSGQILRDAIQSAAEGHVGQEALGDIFPRGIVARIGGDKGAIRCLGGKPTRGGRMIGVQRSVRRLVHQCFLQDAVGFVDGALARVDQDVVVPAAKGLNTLMNPDRLQIGPQHVRQPANDIPVFQRLHLGRRHAGELRIDLDLGGQAVIEAGSEQIGVDRDPVIDAPVEHRPHTPPGVGSALKGGRVRCRDDVGIEKDRPPEGRVALWSVDRLARDRLGQTTAHGP